MSKTLQKQFWRVFCVVGGEVESYGDERGRGKEGGAVQCNTLHTIDNKYRSKVVGDRHFVEKKCSLPPAVHNSDRVSNPA